MQVVIVNMKDYVFADAVTKTLEEHDNHSHLVERVSSPEEIKQYAGCATVVLMETTEFYPPYSFARRMEMRDYLKSVNPGCKVILMVDENAEKDLADRVVLAKKQGRIDNFVFGTVSATYLKAIIDSA